MPLGNQIAEDKKQRSDSLVIFLRGNVADILVQVDRQILLWQQVNIKSQTRLLWEYLWRGGKDGFKLFRKTLLLTSFGDEHSLQTSVKGALQGVFSLHVDRIRSPKTADRF